MTCNGKKRSLNEAISTDILSKSHETTSLPPKKKQKQTHNLLDDMSGVSYDFVKTYKNSLAEAMLSPFEYKNIPDVIPDLILQFCRKMLVSFVFFFSYSPIFLSFPTCNTFLFCIQQSQECTEEFVSNVVLN